MDHSPLYWLRKWAGYTVAETRANGLAGTRNGVSNAWQTVFLAANGWLAETIGNPGRPIYEPDWDVLVVLDACRVDLMEAVTDEYDFLPETIDTFRSRGSKTPDWMARNFTPDYADEMAHTAYIAGNPYSRELDGAAFARLDEVWRYAWDENLRTIPARPITDRAITTWRERTDSGDDPKIDRMVVHYMQPHGPFVDDSLDTGADPEGLPVTADEFGRGGGRLSKHAGYTVSVERVRAAFLNNLRHVLNDVAVLLDNLDAERVVLTADHGNAFGEFGVWGHPSEALVPAVRQVPWVRVSGTDTHSYEPTLEPPVETGHTDADRDEQVAAERLRALGYTDE